jgi:hypothetical protein
MNQTELQLTHHARGRCLQRSLPAQVLEWLDEYGERQAAGESTQIVYFDKRALQRLEERLGRVIISRLKPLMNAYMVQLPDGTVVTAGWRRIRIQRDRRVHSRQGKQ